MQNVSTAESSRIVYWEMITWKDQVFKSKLRSTVEIEQRQLPSHTQAYWFLTELRWPTDGTMTTFFSWKIFPLHVVNIFHMKKLFISWQISLSRQNVFADDKTFYFSWQNYFFWRETELCELLNTHRQQRAQTHKVQVRDYPPAPPLVIPKCPVYWLNLKHDYQCHL